jgi:thiamine biosynthesis lipoprotein
MYNKRNITAIFFFCIALFFIFWNKKNTDNKPFVNDKGMIFGTFYSITCQTENGKSFNSEIKEILESVNCSLSMFNDSSIISKINRNEDVETDSLFEKVFLKAQEISQKTNGAFDITVAPLVNLWGFGLKNCENVNEEAINSALQFVGYQSIKLENRRIVKQNLQTMLDASAIAKGFACDLAADFLKKRGIKNFCVEIGGEVVVAGKNPSGEEWKIGINKPIDDNTGTINEYEKIVHLTDCAMATSGNYRNFYEKDGKKFSHTINPENGLPVQHNLLSASIVSKDCVTADAYATACMVLGLEKSLELCRNIDEIEGFFIFDDNGTLKEIYSEGLKKYLK